MTIEDAETIARVIKKACCLCHECFNKVLGEIELAYPEFDWPKLLDGQP